MYRRELLILATLAMSAVAMVVTATGLLVSRLNVAVNQVAEITVPDFLSTGQLIQRLLENWSRVLLIQQTSQPDERLRLIAEIEANSTDSSIQAFQRTPTLPEQQSYLDTLISDRAQFITRRREYFETVAKGDMSRAEEILNKQLIPAFRIYRKSADTLYGSTAEIGKRRAEQVVHVSRFVVWGAGILSVLVFVAGFFVGHYTIFRGLKWAHILANCMVRKSGS